MTHTVDDRNHNSGFPIGEEFVRDRLAQVTFAFHLAVVAYVGVGWMINTREGLLAYVLLLPAIVLQWLANRGESVIDNIESLIRTGRWRDPSNSDEGHFFQRLFAYAGLHWSTAQVNVLVLGIMALLWQGAFIRMLMIVP